MLVSPTARSQAIDPDVVHESARRQFWLSLALLFALAFAALGLMRPAGEARVTTGFLHSHVVAPTFAPPPLVHRPQPSNGRVRMA
jgi:hypothetical protein